MWYELIMLPTRNRLGKMLMWCDNCGSHLTQAVKNVITECDTDVAYLPKKMTSELLVLDLVVNGPLKTHILRKRAMRLYDAFQEYKLKRELDTAIKFVAPAPLTVGIRDLILLFEDQFTYEKFRECIVVVPGIPGLRAVPDLVTIHPIFSPTVHLHPCNTTS